MKRFTATEKWAKPWFQDLAPRLKCLWQFICDNADAAGVWEPNFRLASFQIGEPVSETDLAAFGDRFKRITGGKIHVLSFIEFQYGKLSSDCKAHNPIFRAIEKHSLTIPYPKATGSLKEEDKDKETEEDKETEGGCKGDALAGFDDFWKAYPRREAKENARKAWRKNKCSELLPQILTGIRLAKSCENWTKEGGQFIPHPATWLNRHGWEDDPSTWPTAATRKTVAQQQAEADTARTYQPAKPLVLPRYDPMKDEDV